jgi:hypothetical protein
MGVLLRGKLKTGQTNVKNAPQPEKSVGGPPLYHFLVVSQFHPAIWISHFPNLRLIARISNGTSTKRARS